MERIPSNCVSDCAHPMQYPMMITVAPERKFFREAHNFFLLSLQKFKKYKFKFSKETTKLWQNFPFEHFCLILRKPNLDRFCILLGCQIMVRSGTYLAFLFRRPCGNYGAFLKPGTYFIEQTRYLCSMSLFTKGTISFWIYIYFIDFGYLEKMYIEINPVKI